MKTKNRIFPFVLSLILVCLVSCKQAQVENENLVEVIENPTNKVILSSEIEWEKLNPARGNQSPQAGTIWGDRNGTEATGFLAKFQEDTAYLGIHQHDADLGTYSKSIWDEIFQKIQ